MKRLSFLLSDSNINRFLMLSTGICSYSLLSFIVSDEPPESLLQRNPEENGSCETLGLPTPIVAQNSKVHITRNFLSSHEIQELVAFAQDMKRHNNVGVVSKDGKGVVSSSFDATVWTTAYLHTNSAFEKSLPVIKQKIFDSLVAADRQHFHILEQEKTTSIDATDDAEMAEVFGAKVNIRTVEFHEYIPGGNLKEKLHYDAGSCITVDICLSDNFEGGELTFPEHDGTITVVDKSQFSKGDAAFFMSHKYHNVLPVTSGLRRVLVAELWKGPKRTCPHRCTTTCDCSYSLSRNHMERSRENLSILG
jgi:hypothetical protein